MNILFKNKIYTLKNTTKELNLLLYKKKRIMDSSHGNHSWVKKKEDYKKMSLPEKRKLYASSKVVPLEEVQMWPQYYESNKYEITKILNTNSSKIEQMLSETKCEPCNLINSKVSLFIGDITSLEIGAIVNAANNYLQVGGGVCGAIHRAAGSYLQSECGSLNGCNTGSAKITGGYMLPAQYVIHAVGPRGEDSNALRSCYTISLNLALQNGLRSIAFPCISTGIFGYPNDKAALVAMGAVREFLEKHYKEIDRVIFCLFLKNDIDIYHAYMNVFFPISKN